MTKVWQPYAQHILDAIEKIRRIEQRGDLASVIEQHLASLQSCIEDMLKRSADDGT